MGYGLWVAVVVTTVATGCCFCVAVATVVLVVVVTYLDAVNPASFGTTVVAAAVVAIAVV